jgi:hypothetical protein
MAKIRTMERPRAKVSEELLKALKGRPKEASVADIVAWTGMPKAKVEEALPALCDEFGAHFKVTESGELLYSFPKGFKSRYTGFGARFSRFMRAFGKGAKAALAFLFKAWILVMLVGYFALFLLIAVASLVVSFAGGASSDNRGSRRGGGAAGLWIAGRILEGIVRIWMYSQIAKSLDGAPKPKRRPLHKAVFSFVFGDGDPNADWDSIERRAFLSWLATHKGIITLEEFIALSGRPAAEAESVMTRYLSEFEGLPEVSDEGAIYYRFKSVMRRAQAERAMGASPVKKDWAFSSNEKRLNRWFAFFNGFNILFGSYFIYGALTYGNEVTRIVEGKEYYLEGFAFVYSVAADLFSNVAANPAAAFLWGLGIVPIAFSILFYLIPFLRFLGLKGKNEALARERLRQKVYGGVLANPRLVRPASLPPAGEAPAKKEAVLKEIAAAKGADIVALGEGDFSYDFKRLAEEAASVEAARAKVSKADFELGATIFDTEAPGDQ